MSDIVWAINPQKDHLSDLTQRMRRFASDLFTARQIEFTFSAPGEEQALKIGADLRRQVFLIFKEPVNNIARHSAATEAQIEMRIENRWLTIKVADNGSGLDPADRGPRTRKHADPRERIGRRTSNHFKRRTRHDDIIDRSVICNCDSP